MFCVKIMYYTFKCVNIYLLQREYSVLFLHRKLNYHVHKGTCDTY